MTYTTDETRGMADIRAALDQPDMTETEAFLRLYEERDGMSIWGRRTQLDLEGRIALLEMENSYLRKLLTDLTATRALKSLDRIFVTDPGAPL